MDELISNDNGVRSALNALDEITAEEYGLALAEVSVGVQELPSEIQTAGVLVVVCMGHDRHDGRRNARNAFEEVGFLGIDSL